MHIPKKSCTFAPENDYLLVSTQVFNLRYMKERLLTLVMLTALGFAPCLAANSLVLHFTDSTQVVCKLANEPLIHFDFNTFTLLSQGSDMGSWVFADVAYWNFQDLTDAIDRTEAERPVISIEDGKLTVEGTGDKDVAVYDVAGRLVTKQAVVDMHALPGGTYVLRVGDNSIKFMVR